MDFDDDPFTVNIEWIIENFSCWDQETNGSVIECPDTPSLPDFKVSLHYHRTPIDAQTMVSCFFGKHRNWDGVVIFLGADQSILGMEKIRATEGDGVTVPAPNLSSVAEELEDDHGNFVTLRFRFTAPGRGHISLSLCTTIAVLSDVHFKFSRCELLKDIESSERKLLVAIVYNNSPNYEQVEVHLERVVYYRTPNDILPIYLELRPATNFVLENFVVKCCTDLIDDAGTLLRSDSFCRAFKSSDGQNR